MDILSGENIRLDARYLSSDLLAKRLVERSAAEEVLKMEVDAKISRAGLNWGKVERNILKTSILPPK